MCIWTWKWIHRKVYLHVKVCHWPFLFSTIHPLCGSMLSFPVLKSLSSYLSPFWHGLCIHPAKLLCAAVHSPLIS